MKVEMKLEGLEGVLELLQSLPREVVSKAGGPVKLALKEGAMVIRDAAAANLAAVTQNDDQPNTGLLASSVIASRGKALRSENGERYFVRVKRRNYNRKGQPVTTIKTAKLLEYGSSKQPPEPWLRPAFLSNAERAISVIESSLKRRLDQTVKKLAKTSK